MEWLRKLLEGATIKDGKLDVDGLMKSINTEFPKNAVPKDKFNEVSEAKKQLETDIKERDTQLETLKKSADDNSELQKQIETLQADNKKKDEGYQAQLKDLTLTNAIKLAIADKAQDIDLVTGLFDKSKLILGDDMAVISYAEQFERELQQKYSRELTSYALTQSNPGVKFINAQTIKLPRLTLSGYRDHKRNAMGFNTGTIANDWEPKKLAHDRDIEFALDPMDIDETNLVLEIANIQKVFETEQAIPEKDSYRYSKLYAEAKAYAFSGKVKFASSKIELKEDKYFIKYKGDKDKLVLLKDNRAFITKELGEIVDGKVNEIPRFYDT